MAYTTGKLLELIEEVETAIEEAQGSPEEETVKEGTSTYTQKGKLDQLLKLWQFYKSEYDKVYASDNSVSVGRINRFEYGN